MAARRAVVETKSSFHDTSITALQHVSARRAAIEEVIVDSPISVATAQRAIAAPISFEPDEALSITRPLPKITASATTNQRRSLTWRRSMLGVAAAATVSAALVVPSAVSTVTAQPASDMAYGTQITAAEARAQTISRDGDRVEIAAPLTAAEASTQASATAEQARLADEERLNAAKALEGQQAAAAEEARKAEEDRLAAEQAKAEAAKSATSSSGSSSAGNSSAASPTTITPATGGVCAYGDGSQLGLTAKARAGFQAICAQFPNVSSYGGWRSSADDHGAGQAIDIMISGSAGWEVANWLVANSSSLSVEYVIFEQKCWGSWAPGAGFVPMADRGSITANHYDHVHVTIR